MTILGDTVRQPTEVRLVGSDRVLAVLVELAKFPDGASLDDMARAVASPKPTVHRALASLCKAGLADKDGRGHYVLGDEFLRLAFVNHELRPDHVRVQPILARLAARFGETRTLRYLTDTTLCTARKWIRPSAPCASRPPSAVGMLPTQLRLASCSFLSNCRMSKR